MADRLVYSNDPERLISLARENGLTDQQIVDKLTSGQSYPERRVTAAKFAEAIGITEAYFLTMAGQRE